MGKSTADDVGDGLDDETFERVAEETRPTPDSTDRESAPRYRDAPGTGEDEAASRRSVGASTDMDTRRGREPADIDGRRHEPPARLDDPRVPLVPESTADAGETDAQSAARLGEGRSQDAWGEPEDAPDHADNEAYEQQRAPREG